MRRVLTEEMKNYIAQNYKDMTANELSRKLNVAVSTIRGYCARARILKFKRYVTELSPRETEIMELLCAGLTNREISEKLCLAISTIKTHIIGIYNKYGLSGVKGDSALRVKAVLEYLKQTNRLTNS